MPLSAAQKALLQADIGQTTLDINALVPDGSTGLGTISQFPLPARPAGATWPFVNNGSSKQCDMGYCPLNNRIYAQGGDTVGSATDGTYSVDATFVNDWRTDVGKPIFPTLVAPHALQDDFGMYWRPLSNEFILVPGVFSSYDPVGSMINNYVGGLWFYDPVNNAYRQVGLSLFPRIDPPSGGLVGSKNTGCPMGAVYDPTTDQIFAFVDSTGAPGVNRWNVGTLTQLTFHQFPGGIAPPPGMPTFKGCYFMRTRPTLIGRTIYVMAYSTDGTSAKVPRFFGMNADTLTFSELAAAPVAMATDLEMAINQSKGKVVWLKIDGPDGVVKAIYIYDPASNTWTQDTQPLPASFIGNVSCSLPDGRIATAGSVFGPQQTMFNFYSVN